MAALAIGCRQLLPCSPVPCPPPLLMPFHNFCAGTATTHEEEGVAWGGIATAQSATVQLIESSVLFLVVSYVSCESIFQMSLQHLRTCVPTVSHLRSKRGSPSRRSLSPPTVARAVRAPTGEWLLHGDPPLCREPSSHGPDCRTGGSSCHTEIRRRSWSRRRSSALQAAAAPAGT